MSVRVVLEALRAHGGEASLDELRQHHYRAGPQLRVLRDQGYVQQLPDGRWRLTTWAREATLAAVA